MLAVTLVQVVFADRRRLLRRPDAPWASAATSARACSTGSPTSRPGRSASFGAPSLITRITNDVQQVQMLVLMTCTLLVAAPITIVGGVVMALREDVGAVVAAARQHPGARRQHRARRVADGPAVPGDAGAHRRRQPGAARADHRHPGGAGLRPRAATRRDRFGGANDELTDDVAARRPADGVHVPDRDAGPQRVERRRALVRRRPDRRAATCRSARWSPSSATSRRSSCR